MAEQVVIVGGGVSGLSTAYFLAQAGIRSTIVEKSGRLGGLIKTDFVEGCYLEAGPDSYVSAKPAVTELSRELGSLDNEIIPSNDRRRRVFLFRDGKLVPMPRGMVMMVPGRWAPTLSSGLFSPKTKLRFLSEIFVPPRERSGDISVAEFVVSHFGKEVLESVAEPLLTGVYGGDAELLSARSVLPTLFDYERRYGSLIRGVRQHRKKAGPGTLFQSFRRGMQSLTDALAEACHASVEIVHAEVTDLQRSGNEWRVKAGALWLETENVVLACPASVSANLLEAAAPKLAFELAAIPYSSAIVVTLVYERSQFKHPLQGFGLLVPRAERRCAAAVTWANTKFPQKVRADRVVLRAFIVGANARQLMNTSKAGLIEVIRADLCRLMNLDGAPPLFANVHVWPDSMPQYIVGHQQRCRNIESLLREHSGLFLANNTCQGVGISDCIARAKETAKNIIAKPHPARETQSPRN